jgi:hypothetical protein
MSDHVEPRIDNALLIAVLAQNPEHREFLSRMRDALLAEVDAIERVLGLAPTTSEIRKEHKDRVHHGY